MTRTIQINSKTLLNETGSKLNIKEPETEDNRSLFLSVFDSLNNLYEKLIRINYLLERKKIEKDLYQKEKGADK